MNPNVKLLEYRDDGTREKEDRTAYKRWRMSLARRLFKHLDGVIERHPHFAAFMSHRDPQTVEGELELVRKLNADTPQGCISWIQREETLEVEQAFYNGDFESAVAEAFDELVVVVRKIAWIESYARNFAGKAV